MRRSLEGGEDAQPRLRQLGTAPLAPDASVAGAAATRLRQLVLRGDLSGGDELRDTEISAQLGIARPTARAAVATLVAEGLLERRPGHSARVRRLTVDDVRDIHRLRRLVEADAVRAIIADDLDLSSVRSALAAFPRGGDDWGAGPDADVRFHLAVVAAAGSARLTRTFTSVATEMRLIVAMLRAGYRSVGELYDEHAILLAALESGDADAAAAAWHAHLDDGEHVLIDAVGALDARIGDPRSPTPPQPATRPTIDQETVS